MTKRTWWLLGIFILLVLIFLGIMTIRYFGTKPTKTTNTNSVNTNQTQTTTNTNTNSENNENNASTGWKTFKNLAQSYMINYPADATVENGSDSEGEKDKTASQAGCVKISTKYFYVLIAGRSMSDDVSCLRTGMGTEWSDAPDKTITVAGQEYTVKGMKTEAASAGYYNDTYLVTLLSGEKIEFGISVNEKYDDAMTKDNASETVKKIVESFSPAE